ncbi:ProQ/FINO family protein [Aquabacterium sp.]|uniref:ProQ/FINO family protein n=1 Tax=Aquabacterium sp. TaxID=1872578 RepID=UPI003B6875B2
MSSTPSVPATPADDQAAAVAADAAVTPMPADTAAPAAEAGSDAQASYAATAADLAERFPALFAKGQAKPLKLRIQVDIQERAPGVFTKQALSAFFRRYTHTTAYLTAVSQATERFDLDGQPAGELSEEHRNLATEELARRRAIVKARREEAFQAQREAQREARKQERAAHQQDREAQQERRARAQLLRDFDTTRLTTANFCALKGIDPAQLETVLAQAREEAKQDALRPRPEGRRDHRDAPRGERRGGPRADGAPREGRGPRREGGRPAGGGARPPRKPQA